MFLLVLFLFFGGLNVYGWRTSGVNHILIFEINPRNHLSELHIMEISMTFGIFWTLSVLGFIFSESLGVPAYVNPLLLLFAMLIFLLNPFKILFYGARCWFLKTLVCMKLSIGNREMSLTSHIALILVTVSGWKEVYV